MNTPIGEAAWAYVTVRRLFQPLRDLVGLTDDDTGNPLAAGHFCDTCGTRLDKTDRPCPMCPAKRTVRSREAQSSAVAKVGAGAGFLGAVVLQAIASAA